MDDPEHPFKLYFECRWLTNPYAIDSFKTRCLSILSHGTGPVVSPLILSSHKLLDVTEFLLLFADLQNSPNADEKCITSTLCSKFASNPLSSRNRNDASQRFQTF